MSDSDSSKLCGVGFRKDSTPSCYYLAVSHAMRDAAGGVSIQIVTPL